MNPKAARFKEKLSRICEEWITSGLPSRQVVVGTAEALSQWKQAHQLVGLWPNRPLMVTATLDDGLGYGIDIIKRYAQMAGLDVNPLGLLQKPESILDTCRKLKPAILGLTILQWDSEADLEAVGMNRPQGTCLIAGGPVFKFDPDMAKRCRVDFVAPNVAYFLDYLLKWTPI